MTRVLLAEDDNLISDPLSRALRRGDTAHRSGTTTGTNPAHSQAVTANELTRTIPSSATGSCSDENAIRYHRKCTEPLYLQSRSGRSRESISLARDA
jgi:hypothetical protein